MDRSRNLLVSPNYHSGHAKAKFLSQGLPDEEWDWSYPYLRKQMDDTVGEREHTNRLTLHSDDWFLGTATGKNGGYWEMDNWPIHHDPGRTPPGLGDLSDDVAGTMALARANPSRPTVDLWNFIYEIKDIPGMVRDVLKYMRKYGPNPKQNWPRRGKSAAEVTRDIGSGYLNWTFGWDLLIKDIVAMVTYVAAVEKRQQDLSDLRNGVLRKTVQLGDFEAFDEHTAYWGPLYQASSRYRLKIRGTQKVWARVRYKPSTETFKYRGRSDRELAEALCFGHTPSISTLWNALPWTWLIDWFSTAGDYFAANRNELRLQVDDVAIMRHATMKMHSFEWIDDSSLAVFEPNPHYSWERKLRKRWTGSPVITAYIPNLGWKQLSIINALASRYVR